MLRQRDFSERRTDLGVALGRVLQEGWTNVPIRIGMCLLQAKTEMFVMIDREFHDARD